jgi:lipopolysaccharide transport system ATP-binding protein
MSSSIAICVENLGKCYQIRHHVGHGIARYKSFREVLTNTAAAPFRKLASAFKPQVSALSPQVSKESFWALKDVCFEIKQGEAVGIIGRNGAGKSTLLKLLSRITEPSTGQIGFNGRVASLLEVGTGFHNELTGRENIYLNGAILGMPRDEIKQRFDEIVAFAEVERFLDTPVKRYSSGMYMRLAFAVAAHLQPDILIVDEVLAVGDAEFQKKCLGKMDDVSKAGRTVIFVSHQMSAIERLCSRVILLRSGNLVKDTSNVRSAVTSYLQGDASCSESDACEWRNTHSEFRNPWFYPYRFCIEDARGNTVSGPCRADQDLWITVEANIEEVEPALTIGYSISTDKGELLYWSYQTDRAPDQWPKLGKGKAKLRSMVPKRLFNEGTYRIELAGGIHHRKWLFEPGVTSPSITLSFHGGQSDSPMWMARRPGFLAPVLPWETVL